PEIVTFEFDERAHVVREVRFDVELGALLDEPEIVGPLVERIRAHEAESVEGRRPRHKLTDWPAWQKEVRNAHLEWPGFHCPIHDPVGFDAEFPADLDVFQFRHGAERTRYEKCSEQYCTQSR